MSHSDPQLRPLKTGAARIALSAEAEHDGKLGVTIVPGGAFLRPAQGAVSIARASGGRRAAAGGAAAGGLPPRRARHRRVADRRRSRGRLDDVVLQAESRDLLEGIARVARWTGQRRQRSRRPGGARHRRARELAGRLRGRSASAMRRASRPSPPTRAPMRGRCATWACATPGRWRSSSFARGAWRRRSGKLGAGGAAWRWSGRCWAGSHTGWPGKSRRAWTRDEDILGTVKLLAGAGVPDSSPGWRRRWPWGSGLGGRVGGPRIPDRGGDRE